MSQTLVDLLLKKINREEKYFKDYLEYAKKIKKEAQKILGEVRVFVFGSVLEKEEIPRDIDILIISPKLKSASQKSKIRTFLWKKGFSSPFELHFVTPKEFKEWYSHFIKKKIEV